MLDTAFGDGDAFLSTRASWTATGRSAATRAPQALLHYVGLGPAVPGRLAPGLAEVGVGLLPGVQRLEFDDGRVLLTLLVPDPGRDPSRDVRAFLREQPFDVDQLRLGPDESADPGWIRTLAAHCRPGASLHLAAPPPTALRAALDANGFVLDAATAGRFAPRWVPRRRQTGGASSSADTRQALVIGGGLAGASVAFSLARRGWQVTVLDRAPEPAGGASGLPAGLVAPHVSRDDRGLSQLTRAGARATLARARALLVEGSDWAPSGVLEHRVKEGRELPPTWHDADSPGRTWSRPATAEELARAGLAADHTAHWHLQAGWIRPAALVRAMLAQPGIAWRGGQAVARLTAAGARWAAQAADGLALAEADIAVVAAGYDSLTLLTGADAPALPLHPLRGQVSWGALPDAPHALPPFPVNGLGSLIAGPRFGDGPGWIIGSTFERDCDQPLVRPEDARANLDKLALLLPAAAAALRPLFDAGATHDWAAVRCTVPDRVPVVGPVDPVRPGLLACTAMGARGITLSVLCGELLAAQLMGEPLPVAPRQAQALAPTRWQPRA